MKGCINVSNELTTRIHFPLILINDDDANEYYKWTNKNAKCESCQRYSEFSLLSANFSTLLNKYKFCIK